MINTVFQFKRAIATRSQIIQRAYLQLYQAERALEAELSALGLFAERLTRDDLLSTIAALEARGEIYHRFVKIFYDNIYPIYLNKFIYLKNIKSVIFNIKIQKTNPSEGYHIWHFESSGKELQNRTTSFILYLNDVNEGGETEFLYQKLRVKPLKNRLVLWPAAYTHIHRGNPPLDESKYILTGWTEIPI